MSEQARTAIRYRKKPEWESEDGSQGHPAIPEHIAIDTLEGTMAAGVGDFIIRGVKGEFYPCKPDIFAATYESENGPSINECSNPRCSSFGCALHDENGSTSEDRA